MQTDFFASMPWKEAAERIAFRLDDITAREVNTIGNIWYNKHFTMGTTPHTVKDFKTLLGQSSMAIAASTINGKSAEPIRLLDGFEDFAQKMFTKAHGYRIEEDDIRDLYVAVQMLKSQPDGYRKAVDYLTNYLWNATERSVEGIHASIDLEILYMLSHKFEFEFTSDNDPESPFIGKKLYYGGDTSHCGHVDNYVWNTTNLANFDPVAEIGDVCNAADTDLVTILIDRATMNLLIQSTKMKSYINNVNYPNMPLSKEIINNWMASNGFPVFEVIDRQVRIQKNAKTEKYTPWREGTLVFLPQNDLGTIETCLSNAEIGMRSPGVDYSYYGRVEVANYAMGEKENSAFTEITRASLTECPSIPCIKDIYSLNTKSLTDN